MFSRTVTRFSVRPLWLNQLSVRLSPFSMAARDSLAETANGEFKRTPSTFRDSIGSAAYPAATGRYVLYVSYACPWASRCLALMTLKGLEGVIEVSVVAPIWEATKPGVDEHRGWVFGEFPGATPDPVFGAKTLREVYERSANGAGANKFTVPVLLDRESRAIVNNESSEVVRMFNAEFNAFAKHPEVDLYPAPLRAEIDALNGEGVLSADTPRSCGDAARMPDALSQRHNEAPMRLLCRRHCRPHVQQHQQRRVPLRLRAEAGGVRGGLQGAL